MAEQQLDAGWYEWVTDNLGRDQARATAATRAASAAIAQGLGFNAAANAARASWEADRLAHVAAVKQAAVAEAFPSRVPGSLIVATALAVGGALASIALLLVVIAPWAPCTPVDPGSQSISICPSIRQIAYMFLAGNLVIAVVHATFFLLMWRRRAAAAWWVSVVVITGILGFDLAGELLVVVSLANPNNAQLGFLYTVGGFPALVPTFMELWAGSFLPGLETVFSHWLLLHMVVVELPILFLLSTRPARRWCRVQLGLGGS
jgi:hypothetical protein